MSDRQVTHTQMDDDGIIQALCNPSEDWSPRYREIAIDEIETHRHQYFVLWPNGDRTDVRVSQGQRGKFLHTEHDGEGHNSLRDLPQA